MGMRVLCFVVCDFTLASFGLAQVTNSAADSYTRISGIGSGRRRCFGIGMKFREEASDSALFALLCFDLLRYVSDPFSFALCRIGVGTRGGDGGGYLILWSSTSHKHGSGSCAARFIALPFLLAPHFSVRETVDVVLPPHQLTVLVLVRVPVPDF